jgi:hypothetical protein
MKKAILKGAAAVAILAAWFVLPNIGAHAAPLDAKDAALCEKFAEFAENVAAGRDEGVAEAEQHDFVETKRDALPAFAIEYQHRIVLNVYEAHSIKPAQIGRLTASSCMVAFQDLSAKPAKSARTQRGNKGAV